MAIFDLLLFVRQFHNLLLYGQNSPLQVIQSKELDERVLSGRI